MIVPSLRRAAVHVHAVVASGDHDEHARRLSVVERIALVGFETAVAEAAVNRVRAIGHGVVDRIRRAADVILALG